MAQSAGLFGESPAPEIGHRLGFVLRVPGGCFQRAGACVTRLFAGVRLDKDVLVPSETILRQQRSFVNGYFSLEWEIDMW